MSKPITKADLIEKLKDVPDDAILVHTSDNFELRGATVRSSGHIHLFKGDVKNETFRDGFGDQDTYISPVIKYDVSGEQTFFQIR